MFETQTVIKLHDTDAAGVTFFANFFRIAHTAYEALMTSIGCPLEYIISSADYLVLIAHAEADYERPLVLGEKVSIAVKTMSIGNSSFTLEFAFRGGDGQPAATVKTVHVSVDKKTGDPIPIPEKIRISLQSIA